MGQLYGREKVLAQTLDDFGCAAAATHGNINANPGGLPMLGSPHAEWPAAASHRQKESGREAAVSQHCTVPHLGERGRGGG